MNLSTAQRAVARGGEARTAVANIRGARRPRLLAPFAALLVAATAAAASTSLLRSPARRSAAEPGPELPREEVRCAATGSGRAARGRHAAAAATAAIERYPFDPRDGLLALQRLLEAERCFELAQDPAARELARARAAAWRVRLMSDCRDHFLRYRIARSTGRLGLALSDVEFLLALCAPEGAPLATSLRRARIEITERKRVEDK